MNGRDICEIANQIRRKVASNNGIDFTIDDCTFTGECQGTCEKSNSELDYLEGELSRLQSEGVRLNLEGVFKIDYKPKQKIKTPLNDVPLNINYEKLEKLKENPELSNLPPRYLDNLLH
ncbi:hypothetical protein [uncultured Methanobrevibacter sp.]|uniref:hypothetical protein n=1 Tax=uncultured Methanobrevibacter sp. TaxID=253161 RepID=UPI002616E121|nr:hypothetical protein [uncultured Methanobrevibacter sp.]